MAPLSATLVLVLFMGGAQASTSESGAMRNTFPARDLARDGHGLMRVKALGRLVVESDGQVMAHSGSSSAGELSTLVDRRLAAIPRVLKKDIFKQLMEAARHQALADAPRPEATLLQGGKVAPAKPHTGHLLVEHDASASFADVAAGGEKAFRAQAPPRCVKASTDPDFASLVDAEFVHFTANGHDAMIRGVTTPPINGTVFALAEWCLSATASNEYLECNCSKVEAAGSAVEQSEHVDTIAGEQADTETATTTEGDQAGTETATTNAGTTPGDTQAGTETTTTPAAGETTAGTGADSTEATAETSAATTTTIAITLKNTASNEIQAEEDLWAGPFDTDIRGTGFGGTVAADVAACQARCVEDPMCQAIQFPHADDHEADGKNCFTFDNQDDSSARYKSYQIYKLARAEGSTATSAQDATSMAVSGTFPECREPGQECLNHNCRCGGESGRCCGASAHENNDQCTDDVSSQCAPCKTCLPEPLPESTAAPTEAVTESTKEKVQSITAKTESIGGGANAGEGGETEKSGACSVTQASACLSIGLGLVLTYF